MKTVKKSCETWDNISITSDLIAILSQVENYLDLNKSEPSRSEQILQYSNVNDPLNSLFGEPIQAIKKKRLLEIWGKLESVAHHQGAAVMQNEFEDILEDVNQIILAILAPTIASNQKEIQEILAKEHISDEDKTVMYELILRKGANLAFLLENTTNPLWFDFLLDKGIIKQPLAEEATWKIVIFLDKIADKTPQKVTDYVNTIQNCSNASTLFHIANLVNKVEELPLSFEYIKHMQNFIKHDSGFVATHEILTPLVHKWGNDASGAKKLIAILNYAIRFHEKIGKFSEPKPYVERWDYEQIVFNVLKPFSDKHPFLVATNLLYRACEMIELHQYEDKNNLPKEDFSEFWCKDLKTIEDRHEKSEKFLLIHALVYACEQVYILQKEKIVELDKQIRGFPWKIFYRLRFHLYAKFPSITTLPWISAYLLEYPYDIKSYYFEIYKCIKSSCEYFKEGLLTQSQLDSIVKKILLGPPEKSYQDQHGNLFSNDDCARIKEVFHFKQLLPFYTILPQDVYDYHNALKEKYDFSFEDKDYRRVSYGSGGVILQRSPKNLDELSIMPDDEILSFLNEWDSQVSWHESRKLSDDGSLFEVNYRGLGEELKKLFLNEIFIDKVRLSWWENKYVSIQREEYLRAILEAFKYQAQKGDFSSICNGLTLCACVFKRKYEDEQGIQQALDEQSLRNLDYLRSDAVEYVKILVSTKNKALHAVKDKIYNLFDLVYEQYDNSLDRVKFTFDSQHDYFLEGVYNARSEFINTVIQLAIWAKDEGDSDFSPKVLSVLDKRLTAHTKYPLTLPEYAIFAVNHAKINILDEAFAKNIKGIIFNFDEHEAWFAAFSSLVLYSQQHEFYYKTFPEHFSHAIEKLPECLNIEHGNYSKYVKMLGLHLFYYYLCGYYSMDADDSLLFKYYNALSEYSENKASIFGRIGSNIKQSSADFPSEFIEPSMKFCEWRIKNNDIKELQKISRWIEADCFSTRWRLEQFKIVLKHDYEIAKHPYNVIGILCSLYDEEKLLTLECLEIIVNNAPDGCYFDSRKIKPLLKDALSLEDSEILKKGFEVQNAFLNRGYQYLELDLSSNQ